jgi:hypothetical protein
VLRVVKFNKKLRIVDETGALVYQPPDFLLPLRNRTSLELLAFRLSGAKAPVDEIIRFETMISDTLSGRPAKCLLVDDHHVVDHPGD